jgi:uncharacterized membrane protein
MNKMSQGLLIFFFIAVLFSGVSFYFLWIQVNSITETDLKYEYPIDRIQVLIFLSKPLIFLTPSLLTLATFFSYFLTRTWMKDVVINVVSDTYDKKLVTGRLKHLSNEEKRVLDIIIKYKPDILQSDLVKESGLNSYKITRILNRFEESELIKKERAGITNVIYLKFDPDEYF